MRIIVCRMPRLIGTLLKKLKGSVKSERNEGSLKRKKYV